MKLDQVNSSVLQNMLKNTQRQTGKSANAATQQGDEVSLSHSARLGNRIIQFSLSKVTASVLKRRPTMTVVNRCLIIRKWLITCCRLSPIPSVRVSL